MLMGPQIRVKRLSDDSSIKMIDGGNNDGMGGGGGKFRSLTANKNMMHLAITLSYPLKKSWIQSEPLKLSLGR